MGPGLANPWPITPTVVPEAGEALRTPPRGASTVSNFPAQTLRFGRHLLFGRLAEVGFVQRGAAICKSQREIRRRIGYASLLPSRRSYRVAPRGEDSLLTHARDGMGCQAGPATTVHLGIRTDPLRSRTVGFPTSLLRAVTSWGKSWGGVGLRAQLIPRPPPRLLSPQGYK